MKIQMYVRDFYSAMAILQPSINLEVFSSQLFRESRFLEEDWIFWEKLKDRISSHEMKH